MERIEPEEIAHQIMPSKIFYSRFSPRLFTERDYPHTLALDPTFKGSKKALLWRTKNFYNSWTEVMKELAQIYISVRTSLDPDGIDDINERHLLGFPLTNHYANKAPNWGPKARHASSLRFFVRKKKKGYCGFILHLPFGISQRMRKNALGIEFFTPDNQFSIWRKVHERLDQTMQRASINECL